MVLACDIALTRAEPGGIGLPWPGPKRWRAHAPHFRWSQALPLPWRGQGSADIDCCLRICALRKVATCKIS